MKILNASNKGVTKREANKGAMTFVFNVMILCAIAVTLVLTSCSKDDDPNNGDDRKGEPYKFRVEMTIINTEKYKLAFGLGSYNYVDETGLPRTQWLTDPEVWPDEIAVKSPLIGEFEIPRNFNKFNLNGGVFNIEYDPTDEKKNEIITGKLYVNNKLIITSSDKFILTMSIQYDASKKKYIIKSGAEMIELNKLD